MSGLGENCSHLSTQKSTSLNRMLTFRKFQWEPGSCKATRLRSIKGKRLERKIEARNNRNQNSCGAVGDSTGLSSGQFGGASPRCSLRMPVAVYIGRGPQGALGAPKGSPKRALKETKLSWEEEGLRMPLRKYLLSSPKPRNGQNKHLFLDKGPGENSGYFCAALVFARLREARRSASPAPPRPAGAERGGGPGTTWRNRCAGAALSAQSPRDPLRWHGGSCAAAGRTARERVARRLLDGVHEGRLLPQIPAPPGEPMLASLLEINEEKTTAVPAAPQPGARLPVRLSWPCCPPGWGAVRTAVPPRPSRSWRPLWVTTAPAGRRQSLALPAAPGCSTPGASNSSGRG